MSFYWNFRILRNCWTSVCLWACGRGTLLTDVAVCLHQAVLSFSVSVRYTLAVLTGVGPH